MFNIPNLLTTGNMLCGVLSILLSLSGFVAYAPFPIFLGAVFDFLDGFAARILKQQNELGKQLDSLADMITFGLAPGVMMMAVLIFIGETSNVGPWEHRIHPIYELQFTDSLNMFSNWFQHLIAGTPNYLPFLALLIPIFSMFRLAKFNLDTRQSDRFIGVPTPANTLFFCMFPLILFQDFPFHGFESNVREFVTNPLFLSLLIALMSVLLISELPLFALKFKHFKWKGNEIRYGFLITCSLLIPFTLYWSLGIIIILYLILSVIDTILSKNKAT